MWFRPQWLILLAASLAITVLAPLLVGGVDAWKGVLGIPPWGMAAVLAMVAGAWLCNAYRIHQLAGGAGLRLGAVESLRFVMSAEFAGLASPAYVGAPATYLWLFNRRGLSPGRGTAVLVMDQIVDLVFFAVALPLMLLLSLREASTHEWVVALALMPVLSVPLLLLVATRYRRLALWLGRQWRRFDRLQGFRWRLARGLLRFREAVRATLAMGRWRLFRILVACSLHWLLRYGVLPVLLVLVGEPQSWAWLFLVQAVVLFAGHLTAMPGGAGGVEAAFGLLLAGSLAAGTLGTVLLAWRFTTFHWYLLVGAPVFIATVGSEAISRRRT